MTARARRSAVPIAKASGWEIYYVAARRIPRGKVATYGQIALVAGRPGAARQVGFAMAALHGDARGVPWWRVLGAHGRNARITIADPRGAAEQRRLLRAEGIFVDERNRVSLEHAWARARVK